MIGLILDRLCRSFCLSGSGFLLLHDFFLQAHGAMTRLGNSGGFSQSDSTLKERSNQLGRSRFDPSNMDSLRFCIPKSILDPLDNKLSF